MANRQSDSRIVPKKVVKAAGGKPREGQFLAGSAVQGNIKEETLSIHRDG